MLFLHEIPSTEKITAGIFRWFSAQVSKPEHFSVKHFFT
jgi:hypothetical protein